ncbi:Conserved_hypothetical protein [Hexamita inflata]|uniref:Uncharacterized protein n=2 Tax=Hexamita inflata TaxID=28002 RepID=A0AA86U474_9EUKA|nr:Conserved hypothetical protein [Hexamita inflata]
MEINTFAIFGFSQNKQIIQDSIINVTLKIQVLVGTLLCKLCDLEVNDCTFIFVASGQQISGMIIESIANIIIQRSFIQNRISSMNSSGLINIINSFTTIQINNCKLAGSNALQNDNNGYISSVVIINVQLNMNYFHICVDATKRFGINSISININESEIIQCDICHNQYVVYGLCSDPLQFGQFINGTHSCVHPFEFVENKCVCINGYILNGTLCINILDSISQIYHLTSNQDFNISGIENSIISNYSKCDNNLQLNTSVLDWRIFYNISSINQVVSSLNQTINAINMSLQQVNDSLTISNQIIKEQQNIISNLKQQINCTSTFGYAVVNGVCVQVSCPISGQQSVNGICQCTIINSIVQNGICMCPSNSSIIQNVCVCNIVGQAIKNGECACQTNGAFVENEACTCGINSINQSNVCSCPSGAALVSGLCTCTLINAYISGNQCICPQFSIISYNSCDCPSNSQIVNNICVCNQIVGQVIRNGSCQCPSGLSVINGSCQQLNYVINSSDLSFTCAQQIYSQRFTISSVTHQISSPGNFSKGYVFPTEINVENAFIEIDDNVYTTVYPLFQSQSSFINIYIQCGTQTITGGSFISENYNIAIIEMSILSKINNNISVTTGVLNILQQNSNNTNIQNLLVNFTFTLQNGNITLINSMSGMQNITNYQISGLYQSYKCISLISLITSSTTIIVNNLNFQPSIFRVGNYSSYLLSSVNQSAITLNNIAIIIGNISKFQELISKSYQSNYNFGGIITYLNGTCVNINFIISSCYHNISTAFLQNSGFLIGYAQGNTSNVTIANACMQYEFISPAYYNRFGIIGMIDSNLSFSEAQISVVGQLTQYETFGIIGHQTKLSNLSQINNLYVVLNIQSNLSNPGNHTGIGPLFGANFAKVNQIHNTLVNNSNVCSYYYNGGLMGTLSYTTAELQNITVQFVNMTNFGFGSGGLLGYAYNSIITISNTTINSIRISGPNGNGIVLGFNQGGNTFKIQNSKSIGSNYINKVLKANCDSFINTVGSVTQC